MENKTIYDFTVRTLDGNETTLKNYKGKVILIANTASECSFTPQLKGLERLHRQYQQSGFEVLAFPSNDFSGQEPLDGKAIDEFCRSHYQTTFTVFNKIHVRGENADPLFLYLSSKKILGISYSQPRWNFYKYVISREGEMVTFFTPLTSPGSPRIRHAIERFL